MISAQNLACCLIVWYFVHMSVIVIASYTKHWAVNDEFHMGVWPNCDFNTSGCYRDTDIEGYRYLPVVLLLISLLVCLILLVISMLLLCKCSWIKKRPRLHVAGTIVLCIVDTSAVIAFVFASPQLTKSYRFGWSFFLAVSAAIYTALPCVVLLTRTLYYKLKLKYMERRALKYMERRASTSSERDTHGRTLIFKEPPKNVSVNIGETVSVHAIVLNANKVYWCKGRDHVRSISPSFQEAFNGQNASLTLTNARPQDDGEYTCVAENYGQGIKQTFSIFVNRVKPVFRKIPKDVIVYLGSTLRLEAVVENADTVSWLHDGEILNNSRNKIAMNFLHGTASLIIRGVTRENEGNYTCCAKSGVNTPRAKEESVHCYVKIKESEVPSFTNVPKSVVKVRRHKTLEIAIKVHGFPLPEQVTWFKDGEPLLRSREIILQYLDGDSSLLIHDTGPLNSGLYECCAENEYGNTTCRIQVQILQEEPEVFQCVVCLTGRPTHVLRCGHAYCAVCLKNLSNCATCRKSIQSQDIIRIYWFYLFTLLTPRK
uniref:Titin-like n=1 Tax=Crassostrea virginica TaxID=6565 RepID=A0A8B8EXP0_CRAVI|nr:titin-like [Crassostrea virginica]